MKTSNTVVSAIVIAAVLVFAYGVGLLIRQARTGSSPGRTPADVNEAAQRLGPRTPRAMDTPAARAKVKKERTEALEKMKAATDEEKAKFREKVIKQVGGRRGDKASVKRPSQEQAQTVEAPSSTTGGEIKQDPNAPAAGGSRPDTKQESPQAGAEPGRAGPGS